MADVISWLVEGGVKVIVTSSPDNREMEKAKRILSLVSEISHASFELTTPSHPPLDKGGHGGVIDLCGKTNIKQLAAISKASDLFLGVDSAPMHIAAAVGTPVIALFGPTGEAQWGPWGGNHIIFSKPMKCKPCKKGVCKEIELRECMTAIKPNDVKKAVDRITDLHHPLKSLN